MPRFAKASRGRLWRSGPAALLMAVLVSCASEEGDAGSDAIGPAAAPVTGTAASSTAPGMAAGKPALPPGLWKRARVRSTDADLSAEERERVRQLESLGYAAGSVPASEGSVITLHSPARTQPGVNLFTSGHAPEALLVDMDGRILHRWHRSFESLWPDSDRPAPPYWRRARLFPNGDLLVVFEGQGLAKLDRHSQAVWTSPARAHHDLEILASGEIYVLTREVNRIEGIHRGRPFLEDFISVLGSDGRETRRVSLLEALIESPYRHLFDPSKSAFGDLLHTNSIRVLDGRLADRVPAFTSGRVLVSMAVPSLIAVVDLDLARVVWAYRSDFRHQHDPRILENGHLLFFDNAGQPGVSRVIEIDPGTLEERWSYAGDPDHPFFTQTCGTAQRLDNGNTLITESDNGRAFEVSPDGAIVWEFQNPNRAGPDGNYVATLFEMVRLPANFPLWVDHITEETP